MFSSSAAAAAVVDDDNEMKVSSLLQPDCKPEKITE